MTIDSDKGEHVSSFVDGELNKDHCDSLISSMCQDEDMKSCLTRYQMISDSMKNQLPDEIKSDFVNCVMAAIESEPTILSTIATTATTATTDPSTESQTTKLKESAPGKVLLFPSITKKVAGLAIAASVATIAVIGVQSQNQDPVSQVVVMPENSEFVRLPQNRPMTASVDSLNVPKQMNPGEQASTVSSPISRKSVPQLKPIRKFDPILQQYIVNHAQYASGSGVNDIFSHARIVASPQDKLSTDQVKR